MDASEVDAGAEAEDTYGIGGWLALLGVGLVLTPLVILLGFAFLVIDVYTTDMWTAFTLPGGSSYRAINAPLFVAVGSLEVFAFIGSLLANVLFFQKRRTFPKVYVFLSLIGLLTLVIDGAAAQAAYGSDAARRNKEIATLLIAAVTWTLWSIYLLRSKRAHATFTR
jgi:hypothetical protein